MARYITALTIAGSDCSGGAGIQADIKTMSALGVYASTAVTAITVQDGKGVRMIDYVSPDVVAAQIKSNMEFLNPRAIKIGMLGNEDIIIKVADSLKNTQIPVIVDPVLASSDGTPLLNSHAIAAYIDNILPLATLLTPNLIEAQILSEHIGGRGNVGQILSKFCKAVLIKGGHSNDKNYSTDTLFYSEPNIAPVEFMSTRFKSDNCHGTGCTLSSAIASFMALGFGLQQSCKKGKEFISQAIIQGSDIDFGKGNHGSLNHLYNPQPLIKI